MTTTAKDPRITAAAELLRGARRPLVMGLAGISTEAQRVAVAIADTLGGVVDWTASPSDAAAMIAFQTVGAVGATYGEVAERGDLFVYWRCPPEPLPGFDSIGNPADREFIEIGADAYAVKPGADYEALSVLRAIAEGVAVDEAAAQEVTGVSVDTWRMLVENLKAASYVVFVKGKLLAEEGHATLAALTQLGQELHQWTRVAVVAPPADDNRLGAENVLAWQTGFPLAVSLSAGYPCYGPGESDTQTMLERGEVDAVLAVDDSAIERLSDAARENLFRLPRVVLSSSGETSADVCFVTEPLNESAGAYYRTDGLALTLSGEGRSAEQTLGGILEELLARE